MKHDSVEFEVDRVTFLAKQKRFIVDLRVTKPFGTMCYADFVGSEVPTELRESMVAWLSSIAGTKPIQDALNPLK